jgi:L-ascorbate metabolism protein UlaG (beta-lactamase superfamily)
MLRTRGNSLTWLGHAAFRITTPTGKVVLIDPWIASNPSCPAELKKLEGVDTMLITHGHFDHIADAVELGKKFKPQIVAIYEIGQWLESKGVQNVQAMNKGGTQRVGEIEVTMVNAIHSCGILDEGKIVYGGEACGYVLEFSNGVKLYHAGDTNVFSDMAIIRDLYAPKICMLPIGDHFTMSPREAAYACKLLQPETVVPMHFGTFPQLTGTPAALRKLVPDVEVLEMTPGKTIS